MKKQTFLAMIFAFMAAFTMAQTPFLIPADIDTNTVTTHSFDVVAQLYGTGTFYVQVQAKKVGTTVWLQSDTGMYSGTDMQVMRTKDSLLANTDYLPRLIAYNATFTASDTVYYSTVRTKPLPQPVAVISANSVPMLPKSGLRFTASSVGQNAFAFGVNSLTFASVTDTVYFGFTSSFSDTVFFRVDSANCPHSQTKVIVRALDLSSTASSATIPAFSSPAYTAVTMNLGTPTITKDSIRVNLNVTSLGNAGNPMLQVTIKDSLSGSFVYQTTPTLSATGAVTISKGNLLSNRWYIVQALATTPQNMTTVVTLPFKTLNVDPATVTVSQQLPLDYISYTAKAFINPKGSGDSSKAVYAELLEGNTVVNSMVLALTDTGTITFTQIGQTPGATKSIKVRVTNGAGLTTTSAAINVSMLVVGTPMMNISSSGKTTDSVYAKFNITGLGIPLNPTLRVVIKNSAGVTLLDSSRLVTQTGVITISKGGLTSNSSYTITGTFSNTQMLGDTDVVVITTNNVNAPGGSISKDTVDYTFYKVSVTSLTNGTTDSSAIKMVYYYEDGNLVDSSTNSSPSFTRIGRTQGQTYYGNAKIVNLAGLSYTTSQITIKMKSLTPNQDPHISNLFADDAATVRVTNISYGASANNTSTIKLVRKILQANYTDTLLVGTGFIGSGIIPSFTIDNCIGGYTTQVTVIDESPAGTVVGNTLQQNMPLPNDPILADIVRDDNSSTATILAVKVFGSGEGNVSPTLKLWLYKNNTQVGSTFITVVNSGMLDYSYSWDNLSPSTEYKVVAEISAPGAATVPPIIRYFRTDAISGIQEIPQIADGQFGEFSNAMGQVVAKGAYKQTHGSLVGSHAVFFFTPIGDDGLPSGSTRKLFIP